MGGLRISKRHHRRINNPFPSTPRSLPFIHGELSFDPDKLPLQQSFRVGEDFELHWTSNNGGHGHLSVSHQSRPDKSVWSTVPGEAFISAAAVRTEALESRGSFSVIDGDVQFVCKHQTVEGIRVIREQDVEVKAKNDELLSGFFSSNRKECSSDQSFMASNFPVVIVTGWVFNKRRTNQPANKTFSIFGRGRKDPVAARYWFVLEQKNQNQIGFYVKFGEYDDGKRSPGTLPRRNRAQSLSWKLLRMRQRCATYFSAKRTFIALASEEETTAKDVVFAEFNRVFLSYASDQDERFYGFGEQFSCVEFKGKKVPVIVQEQGIGRGDQPITFAANLVSYRSGGDWSTTYAPSPWYMTSQMRAFYLEGYNYSVFDLTKPDRVQIQIHGNSARGRILSGNSPVELIQCFTEAIGRPPELPEWIISGAVVGMQGGTDAVRRVWKQLKDHDVPVSAFWLQDWVGKRKTIIGSQLWWNWEVDSDHYAGWSELVNDLRTHNIRVMTYCNPCLVPMDEKPNKYKDLFEEAKRLDILVKDKDGGTYMIPNTAFDVGMLDFTHPKSSTWFKKILQEMVDTGVRGWMADFGEGLPLDACLYSDEEDPIAAHNRYPELWAKVNREFVDEWKETCRGKGKEDPEESLVFFMRAGFRDSPKWAMLFWEGDQMVSWQANDGIKSSVTGLLSGGLSGFAFNHSDIGGYCTVNIPIIRYQRSEELIMRWMELNAFSTVFRTHEGNKPSSNCQFNSNKSTLAHFARCAKMYEAWKFYRIQLVKEAAQRGLPVARHLFLHYPHDERVHSLTYQQFLVGTEMLVVPVLDKGREEVKAYLPLTGGCSWQHVWSGRIFRKPSVQSGCSQGCEATVEAPIGYPAVFVKYGSEIGEAFIRNLKGLNIM